REIDKDHLVEELRPIVGQTVAARLAHVVRRALAGHASAGRDAVTELVDIDLIGVELEALLLALDAVVAVGRLAAKLDGQIVIDVVAWTGFEFGQALNDRVVIRADELPLEIGFGEGFDEQRSGPALLSFWVTEGNGSAHWTYLHVSACCDHNRHVLRGL